MDDSSNFMQRNHGLIFGKWFVRQAERGHARVEIGERANGIDQRHHGTRSSAFVPCERQGTGRVAGPGRESQAHSCCNGVAGMRLVGGSRVGRLGAQYKRSILSKHSPAG